VALSPEEQQRIDTILDHLHVFRWWIIGIVAAGVVIVGSYAAYEARTSSRVSAAAGELLALWDALEEDETSTVDAAFDAIVGTGEPDHIDSAALLAGSHRFWSGDKGGAVEAYETLIESSSDAGLVALAKLRLIQALIDDGKPDEALDVALDAAYPPQSTMRMLFEEAAGDAMVALGDLDGAREQYALVLELLRPSHGEGYAVVVSSKLAFISQQDVDLAGAERDA